MGYNVSKREAKRLGIARVKDGQAPAQPSSQDATLQGTLGGYQSELADVKSKYHPELLPQFTDVMTKISKIAYDDRKKSEGEHLRKQGVDPSKISGSTFSSILGGLEGKRGLDISKIYGTTMGAYSQSQNQIGGRISTLEKNISEEKNRIQREREARIKAATPKKLSVSEEMSSDLSGVKQSLDNWFKKQDAKGVNNLYVPKGMYDEYRREFIRAYGKSKVGDFDAYLENYLPEDNRYKSIREASTEKKTEEINTFANSIIDSITAGNPDYVSEYKDGSKFINWSAIPDTIENEVRKKLKESNISLN